MNKTKINQKGQTVCLGCLKPIKDLEVVEITTNRIITQFKDNKLTIGDNLITKHQKIYKCEHCHLEIMRGSKDRALKLLSCKTKDI